MATAAEAATSAVEAPATEPAITGQDGQESTTPTPDEAAAAAVAPKKQPSEVVRLAREKRALERKLEELTAKPRGDDKPALTKESVLAELKARYEDDPQAFLEEVAGEDFVKLAQRVAKREETAKAPESKIEKLEKELAALKAKYEGDGKAKADAEASAITQQHLAQVQTEIETSKDEDGIARYPVLASLDADALEEPVAVTAYAAVNRAFDRECREGGKPDGKVVKRWPPEVQKARFHAAFSGLEAHYAKLRTPKTPNTPKPEEPELSPTISNNNSSGHVDPPVRRASGALTVQEALRQALKEHGLQH